MSAQLRTILAVAVCLVAAVASADSITSVSPAEINFADGEAFVTILGSGFTGVTTMVVYDGQISVEPSVLEPERIVAYVPPDVTLVPGRHSINIIVTDATATRDIGPAYVTVVTETSDGPPQISYPEIVVAEWLSASGTPVTFDVTAMSSDGTPLPVNCSPASGSLFARGATSVHCSATDLNGTAEANFVVIVTDTTPPVITAPAQIESATAVVTYTASAVDNLDGPVPVNCTPESGSTFRAGTTLVTCIAYDSYLNPGYAYFDVIVTGGPPAMTLPESIVTQQKVVTYTVTATGDATIVCTPPSGSTFAIGVTTVNCTATNAFGSDTGSFTVEVYDATPPVFSGLQDITTAATSPDGAVVTFNPTAVDAETGPAAVVCSPESGVEFPIGTTLVVCTAVDGYANVAFGTFTVTVNQGDTTPPVLTLTNVTAEATSPAGATVTYTATAFDDVDGAITPTCTPASGSTFPLGVTTVQCSATDAADNTATGSFTVTVEDTTAPEIVAISANPNVLWPPNHQMVLVTVSATVIDSVDDTPITRIISVKSNQPINGTGDGDTAPDWSIVGPMQVELRSERSSGKDRTYKITVESVDDSGNTTTATVEVKVTQTRRRAT